jgi:DNA polymerase-3 subunit gamma/tau
VSFLVTARKWRPQTFAEIVGQEGVTRTLQNAIKAGRIAHAYIFSGPRGVGKTTTARLLAKAVNCAGGPTATPCNQCTACTEIPEGRSLDVLEIDGASNRGVGEIRNLRDNIHFNPAASRKKIYIIDEVHMLTIEAFNALLKTLEEPPEHAMFIFATTEINRVPPTILSRCQRFDFRRISTGEISAHLRLICDQEKVNADDEALELIARRADGAMRDAQSLLDQMATFAPEKIDPDEVRTALGIAPEDLFFGVSDIVINNRVSDVFQVVDDVDSKGLSPREFLRGLTDHFLNLLKAKDETGAEFIEAPQSVRQQYTEKASHFELNDLLRILAILQDAFNEIRRHPQPRLKLELTLLRLASLERTAQIEDLLSALRGDTTGRQTRPKAAQPPPEPQKKTEIAPPPPPSTPPEVKQKSLETTPEEQVTIPIDVKSVRSRWFEMVDQICEDRIPLACQLKMGRPQEVDGGVLIVGFGNDLHDLQLERLRKVAASGTLDDGLQQLFNAPLRLRFERLSQADAEKLSEERKEIDPFEEELIRCLGAKRIA